MKVCIVTITNGSNFGNRLQNLALQETIAGRYGFEVSTLRNISGEVGSRFLKYKIFRLLLENPLSVVAFSKVIRRPRLGKKMQFIKFNNKYIKWEKKIAMVDSVLPSVAKKYDYFIAGSDQVWNTGYPFISSVEFLGFASSEKRISYAASFGPGKFDEYEKQILEKNISFLREFKSLSVREKSSNDVLLSYGITDTPVLVDPTLLLDTEKWRKIEKKPTFLDENDYLLTYFLEDFDSSPEISCYNAKRNKFVRELTAKKGLNIVNINNPTDYNKYAIGPAEFLYLIHHAEYVCTNSFHATVFSLIYKKRFSAYKRDGSRARIDSLLKQVSIDNPYENQEMVKMDYNLVEERINQEREKAFVYLDRAFARS